MPDTPKAKVSLEQIVDKLPSRFQCDKAAEIEAIYQFRIIDEFSFFIEITNQQCRTQFAEHDDPNIILTMTGPIFAGLMSGTIDGMSAYLKGDLKAQGNIILATKLSGLFKKKVGDEQKI